MHVERAPIHKVGAFCLLCVRAKKWEKGDYHNSPKMEFVSITIQLTFTIEIGEE